MSDQNNSGSIAIDVTSVSKSFRLPHQRPNSVKSYITGFYGKKDIEVQNALEDISFSVKSGEFFGIVGRNGSGKSTLLKILAGIYQPSKGSVSTVGKLVPFIELGVGFNPELTGRENVYLNGAMLGFSEREIDEMYKEVVEFAELQRFMDQKLKNYSSGMQVRLAFSMATRSRADILLIDEVLAVGDADFQQKCFSYFKELKRTKKTVVFVSHDMNAIREYCDRAILIEKSRVVFSGSADDTAKEYTRLFMPDVYEAHQKEEKRTHQKTNNNGKWGSGGVDIENLKLSKPQYTQDDEFISITYTTTKTDKFTDDVILGITIKNESGNPLCGTNTKILHPGKKYALTSRQRITTTWKVPNIFNQGTFIVEPAILSGTTNETLMWWDDAIRFKVFNDKKTPYPVAPPISVTEYPESTEV